MSDITRSNADQAAAAVAAAPRTVGYCASAGGDEPGALTRAALGAREAASRAPCRRVPGAGC
jgi:hypothetical protein